MSVSGLLARVDDWINPIVVKELRQAVKSRLVTSVLLLFLGSQLAIVAVFVAGLFLGNLRSQAGETAHFNPIATALSAPGASSPTVLR